jgi:hypothetical protein
MIFPILSSNLTFFSPIVNGISNERGSLKRVIDSIRFFKSTFSLKLKQLDWVIKNNMIFQEIEKNELNKKINGDRKKNVSTFRRIEK